MKTSTQNTVKGQKEISVQPLWCLSLPLQQQSVLFLAARGPDGIAKAHPCKDVQRAYRGTVLVAARYGRCLEWGESADSFMCLGHFSRDAEWPNIVDRFFKHADDLPHHFFMHLMHGAEILGYKHPDERFRTRWQAFYERCVKELHLISESELEMDARLSDWERKHWTDTSVVDGGSSSASGVSTPKSCLAPVEEEIAANLCAELTLTQERLRAVEEALRRCKDYLEAWSADWSKCHNQHVIIDEIDKALSCSPPSASKAE